MTAPILVIGNKAYQPRTFQFSQREFGKTLIVKINDHFRGNGSIAGLGYIMT